MTEREAVALGALLHDIGKFRYRSEKETGTYRRSEDRDWFGHAHAYLSYETAELISSRLGIADDRTRRIVLSACFHHRPDTQHPEASGDLLPVRALFRLADWYASAERSEELDTETEEAFKRLRPVFERVDTGRGISADEFIYRLAPLSVKGSETDYPPVFPNSKKQAEDYARERGSELYEEFYGSYKPLYDAFLKAFEREKRFRTLGHRLSYVYHVLYKYAWCVPASIYDRERYHSHYPDISLFDHSRVVTALATSLYTEENLRLLEGYRDTKEHREELAKKLRIVIFEGDISGIQKFIYEITNEKGVAKRLRGRSVFLSFLPELIGRFILRKLCYPWTNLLYAGGGKFQAVVGYEEKVEERLRELSSLVEEVLVREFGGKLGFVLYSTTASLKDLEDYSRVVRDLVTGAAEAKRRKFSGVMDRFEDIVFRKSGKPVRACPSCRWELVPEEEERTCVWCERFRELGDMVVKARYLIFTDNPVESKGVKGIFLKGIGGMYLAQRLEDPPEEYRDIFILNEPELLEEDSLATGFRFLASVVPRDEDGVKSFEEMVQDAEEGDRKLAFVLADVDNLGYIFMNGLGSKYTISRVATLSRSLDLFFSGYLNTLFEQEEYRERIYTLYAGGDDLFIIAPWDTALRVMKDVRKDFGNFVCGNPSFGLSCGVFLAGENYPVRLAYEGVRRAENRAKKTAGKDRVCALEEVLSWRDLEAALEEVDDVVEKISGKELGRTNFYRIYLLLREYRELDREKDEEKRDLKFMFYPFFYYFLSRNVRDRELQIKLEKLFIEVENDHRVRDRALFLAKYVLMKTRGVRS